MLCSNVCLHLNTCSRVYGRTTRNFRKDLQVIRFPAIQVHVIREKVFRQDRLAVDIPDRIAEDMVITFRKSFRISNDQDLVDAGGKDEKIFPKRIREVF